MKFIGVIFFSIFLLNIVSAIPLVSFNFNTSSSSIQLVEPSIVRSSSAVFQISTERNVLCKYSQSSGTPYDSMEGSFDFNFGTLHKKNLINLVDGSRTYYIACRNSSDNTNSVLTASFNVITPVSAHISFSKYSPLSAGLSTVSVTTSKICASIPQLSFSYNGVSYNPIPLSGAGNSYSGYLLISPTLGNLVGSILFSCTDLEGFTGTEITSGSIFVVDTVYPKTLVDISSIGSKGECTAFLED